ncbi:NnrS family protein [Arvimicrobium flavum]|uniref:NnrS family protein n=1 Tax=Arvimicrobium flavum TaxID=3393320 RepID=UPI00237B381D|nr:NnrS family protein [Mesorhizobium shangrilense]
MAVPRLRSYEGPAFLSYGFRPFFLLGSAYAGLSILFWLPAYSGHVETFSLFAPVDWHVHEMLFGYLAAVVTGFLLTAIPNWTGRLPVLGLPLLGLMSLWIAGRFAVFFSDLLGWQLTAIIDCAFLAAVGAAAAREIISGRNWRNLKVLVPLAVLLAANICFHVEAHLYGMSDASRRLGIGAAILLIMIIGGRIIPSFTRNWLARENPGRLPAPFGRFDMVSLAVSAGALLAWTALPDSVGSAALLAVAGALQAARLARWAGDRTVADPLVLILHLAYAFIPVGMLLIALAIVLPSTVPAAAGIHALGGGAIGAMTLAVMVRATLGHTGRALQAGRAGMFVFAAVLLGGLVRIAAAFVPDPLLIQLAGVAWAAAFLGYAVAFAAALTQPRAI